MKDHSAYKKMLEISEEIGWPQSYKTDLTKHDRRSLREIPEHHSDAQFAWVVNECGTYIVIPVKHSYSFVKGHIEHFRINGANYLYFWWNGKKFQEVVQEQCLSYLQEEMYNVAVRA